MPPKLKRKPLGTQNLGKKWAPTIAAERKAKADAEAAKKEAEEGTGTDDSEEEEEEEEKDTGVVKSKCKQGTKPCKKNKQKNCCKDKKKNKKGKGTDIIGPKCGS